ncbi:MAG TPA: hypothetical protein VMV56_01665 [Williamwhitmania sp.]|nr:hypothetical protein [Williamwhitmania sp.]
MTTIHEIALALATPGKIPIIAAAEAMENNPTLVPLVFELAKGTRQPISWRAAWIFSYLADCESPLLSPMVDDIIAAAISIDNHSQRGCFLKVLSRCNYSVEEAGKLLDFCIDLLQKPTNRPSHKFYCLDILEKFASQLPELRPELIMVVADALPNFETNVLRRKGKLWLRKIDNQHPTKRMRLSDMQ